MLTVPIALLVFVSAAEELPGGWQKLALECSGWTAHIAAYKVAPLKPNGTSWDVDNGAPDVAITLLNSDQPKSRVEFPMVKDQYAARATAPPNTIFTSPLAAKLVASVIDVDPIASDGIASVPLQVEVLERSPSDQHQIIARLYGAAGSVDLLEIAMSLNNVSRANCTDAAVKALRGPVLKLRCEEEQTEAKTMLAAIRTVIQSYQAENKALPTSLAQANWKTRQGSRYVYTYEPLEKAYVVRAVGNLDADDVADIWEMRASGDPTNKQNDCAHVEYAK